MLTLLFFGQLYSKRDSITWKLTADTLLLLKFSWSSTNAIFVFIAFSHKSSFSFLTYIFRQTLTLFFKYSFSPRSTFCFQFLCSEYETVWQTQHNLHFVFNITTLKNPDIKYPTKICLCSQADQNHLLQNIF